ncbi:MAG: hypothetical protein AB7P20_03850 [Rhizobiaceae bacterium]
MLARPGTLRCIECGLAETAPAFAFHGGNPDHGPAYWCDHGVLCSLKCSVAHMQRRQHEGTLSDEPAPDIYNR